MRGPFLLSTAGERIIGLVCIRLVAFVGRTSASGGSTPTSSVRSLCFFLSPFLDVFSSLRSDPEQLVSDSGDLAMAGFTLEDSGVSGTSELKSLTLDPVEKNIIKSHDAMSSENSHYKYHSIHIVFVFCFLICFIPNMTWAKTTGHGFHCVLNRKSMGPYKNKVRQLVRGRGFAYVRSKFRKSVIISIHIVHGFLLCDLRLK